MAFKIWQTGVHIQQDRVLIVALAREKLGWCMRRWWAIPLDEGIIRDGKICQPEQLVDALRDWRKTLPHYHRAFLSFPAARTLQRALPRPTVALRDSEQLSWLGAALARELEMSADTLCFDYAQDTFSNTFHVTAAQNNEIDTLLALAKTLRLWAMRHQWGRRITTEAENVSELSALLGLGSDDIALFDSRRDPWEILERCHAPLPDCGADYTVALALAMSEVPG